MTKHRKKEEWVEEILDAAAARIVEEGYSNLTMESIAARTTLSKGGVYRYFSNKRDVALALFQRVYRNSIDFDVDQIVSLNVPIQDTIRHMVTEHRDESQLRQDHNIWVQLIPETLWDEGFREERKRLFELLLAKFEELFRRIAQRDGLVIPPDMDPAFKRYVYMGLVMREGMTFQSVLGMPLEEQGELYRQLIATFVKEVFGDQLKPA